MNGNELKEFVKKNALGKNRKMYIAKIKKHPKVWDEILNKTSFIIESGSTADYERVFCAMNDMLHRPICKKCGKDVNFSYCSGGRYYEFCSISCGASNKETLTKRSLTKIKRYGSDRYVNSDKAKRTKEERYGSANFTNREKAALTCLERYGVVNPSQVPNVQLKKEETSLRHYGTRHYMSNKEEFEKKKAKLMKKRGVDNPMKCADVSRKSIRTRLGILFDRIMLRFSKIAEPMFTKEEYANRERDGQKNLLWKWRCRTCSTEFLSAIDDGDVPKCPKCRKDSGFSWPCKEIIDLLKSAGETNIKVNDRITIAPVELDIHVTDKKFAIEFDGLYFHTELAGGKGRNYHLRKTEACERVGIRLVHVFEDEWTNRREVVKSKLRALLGKTPYRLYGRKCSVEEIDNATKTKFLEKYHLQGNDTSSVRLGLFHRNRLVSVMTFCRPRISVGGKTGSDGAWELSRFCTVNNFSVAGGAGKLLSYFEKTYHPTSVKTFADRRWSAGGLYKNLGFVHVRNSPPNYWYFVGHRKRAHRFTFRKNLLAKKLEKFNPALSEWENMIENGYDRIWDCGSMVFEKKYDK